MKNIKRVFINVRGYVQGVGYRYYVETKAHKYGVKGYVQNMPEGNVYIDAEEEEDSLNKFVDEIKNPHAPIKVMMYR